MIIKTIPEYLAALFEPLGYVLLAYAMSGPGANPERASALGEALGIADMPGTPEEAWERYARGEERLAESAGEAAREGIALPFERVCGVLGLNAFERFAMALTLAADTEPVYGAAAEALGGRISLGLLLSLYSASSGECIGWRVEWQRRKNTLRLIFSRGENGDILALTTWAKSVLLGGDTLPEGASLFAPDSPLPEPYGQCLAPDVIIRQLGMRPGGNLLILWGAKGAGKRYQIKRFAAINGYSLLSVPFGELRNDDEWLDWLTAASVLWRGLLCVTGVPSGVMPDVLRRVIRHVRPGNLFITSDGEISDAPDGYSTTSIRIPVPDAAERAVIWRAQAGISGLLGELDSFAARYKFTPGQIEAACILARELAAQRDEPLSGKLLREACRRQLSHRLGSVAIPVEARFTWDDIVLPQSQARLLRHICAQVRHRGTVYDDWGFGGKIAYGRGVRALFSGPPGTGKTMAAQVIASELHMELYKVDLSSLVSKYIGDTEKNLDEVFAEAEKSGGILFFDEADAVFGKRGEQKDSHERYANMQTAFLLQRFEDFDGVALLATNLASNLDPAFTRRIQNRVEFPPPTAEYRKRIWRGLLIKSAPFQEGIDLDFLAEGFELTGSAIRNIVFQAAFLAAEAKGEIGMTELVSSLVMELAKSDKIVSRRELGEYGYLEGEMG